MNGGARGQGSRVFTRIGALALGLVCIAHALRVAFQVPVTAGTTQIPVWMSLPAAIVTGTLAVLMWRETRRP